MSNSFGQNGLAKTAVKLWRGETESLASQGASANQVYEFTESGKTLYLRLTSSRDRTKEQIEAELDFIFYLQAGGVGVAPAIASVNQKFIEEIASTDDLFFACVFE